ncbi:MAG: hypothetical protein PHI23_02835 [Candidatus Peribacteraceae bacterium]|nr:hypothetical protein [Candidatus Peribacteraceae bacterium]
MQRTCKNSWCQQPFEITQEDRNFYEKVSPIFNGKKETIQLPTLCPECRLHRRMTWRNERNLFHRTCSRCERPVIALYHPHTSFPVLCANCFFGERDDETALGKPFNPAATFFGQFAELLARAPRIALLSKNSENSEYTNHAADNRNCYLSFIIFTCEDVLYSRKVFGSRNIVDCHYVFESSDLAYECFWSSRLNRCSYLINCFSMSDSHFCIDCRNCTSCFLCSNLRNKQFCFENKQYSPEEYDRLVGGRRGSHRQHLQWKELFRERAVHQTIYKNLEITNGENCSGDYLLNSKNLHRCFYSTAAEDMRYCVECDPSRSLGVAHDAMDVFGFGSSELLYEVQSQANGYHTIANNFSYDVRNCFYIDNCHDIQDCFGCVGLHHKQYCILNKQYAKEEYERLVPRIIEHMRKNGEWGEFFPSSLSPFSYHETVSQQYFPLTKAEVNKRGWRWQEEKDEAPKVNEMLSAGDLPDSIDDISDDILNTTIECGATRKPFKIVKQELNFYRIMRLPIPRLHPDERHRRRMALRNPLTLWNRVCRKCGKEMQTTYAPDRPEQVYCEECYLKEVY